MAISGVTEESWSEENEKALDEFIEDTSITTMVVYMDAYTGLRVERSVPSQVQQISVTTFSPLLI